MAGFHNATTASPAATVLRATTAVAKKSLLGRPPTLSPGHAAILEMHENSQKNALIYIAVVLGLYLLAIALVIIKYVRSERYEARLSRLFHDLMQRDTFFRLSRRHSAQPKPAPTPEIFNPEEPLPALVIPEIHEPQEELESETKV